MRKFLAIFFALLLVAALPLSLCGCANNKEGVIRLNEVTHSVFYAPQYLALALGYFEEVGIEIELTNGAGADNTTTALLTGEADIGLMGPESTLYVYLQGREDYLQVFGQLTKRDGSFLVGRNAETNFDWSNLNGKEILMGRRGGMPAMILQYVLNKKGYTDGVNITMNYDIQFGLLAGAFTGGTADYVPLFEPVASQLQANGQGYIVTGIGRDSGEIPYTCYIATKSFIKENGKLLENFLNCIYKATLYLNSHDNTHIAELIAPYFVGTEKHLLVAALDNYKAFDTWKTTPVMNESSWELLQDVLENADELDRRVDFETLVNTEIAENATKD